jgi:RNA polymerase sigma factor (sigma-70 family)
MANKQLSIVLRQIRRLVGASPGDEPTDGHLLQRFADHRDEAAFATLLRRHGPLVLGVCRRLLGDMQDAEDAFQATFLVLARRAAALDRRGTVAGFLYTVAYRIALRARANAARRRERERHAAKTLATETADELSWRDLRPVLDEELNRLPEKYRAPILLCYLEGKTQQEAAELLGWTKGTVSGRLARARETLRSRLVRRGLAPSAAALSAGLAESASAAVPASLRTATLDAALRFAGGQAATGAVADLTQAALRGMGLFKGKAIASLVLAVAVLTAGTGLLIRHMAVSPPLPNREQGKGEAAQSKAVAPRVDVHGDPLPPGAVVRLGTLRLCQGDNVEAAVFSHDGKMLASSGDYRGEHNFIRLWDLSSGKELRRFPGESHDLAFSPDSRLFAASREFSELCLWNVSTGKQLWCWDVKAEPRAPNESAPKFYGIAFSPDGKTLAVALGDKTVRLIETITGKERQRLKDNATNVAFAPDGKSLACYHFMGKTVSLWNWAEAKKQHTLSHPEASISSLAFSPSGRQLAVKPEFVNKIFLWDTATERERRQVPAAGISHCLRFTPDGKSLSTGDWSFDLATAKDTRVEGWDRGIALSPDCRRWARTLLGSLRVWDTATHKEVVQLDRHYGWIRHAIPSADGKTIRTVGQFDETIREWDAATGKHLRKIQTAPWQKFLTFSRDGRVAAMPRFGGKLVLVDLSSGEIIQECGEARSQIRTMALSADGKRLAVLSGDEEKTLHLWDMVAGKKLRSMRGKVDDFHRLAFSPDGKTLAAAASLDGLRLWDAATGEPLKGPVWKAKRRKEPFEESIYPKPLGNFGVLVDPNAKPKPSPAAGLVFSPSGKTLAVMSGFHRERWSPCSPDAGLLRLYDVRTGKELFQLCQQEPLVVFSPDGKSMVTAGHHDSAVYLWDASNGQQLARWPGHRGTITSLAFSADGRTLISGSADSTALVWDVRPPKPREK